MRVGPRRWTWPAPSASRVTGDRSLIALEGSPSNVLGLSLPLFRTLLAEVGVRITDLWNDRSQPPA